MCLFTNIFRLLLDKIRTRKQVIISKIYSRNLEEKALFLKSITTLSYFLYGVNTIVVNTGHMLGLDQEREELGVKPVSYQYGDPSVKYVCSFVCVYLEYSK